MRNQCNETLIINSIRERKTIAFNYMEDDEAVRTLRIGNPHAIYQHKTTGNIIVDLFQVEGQSTESWGIPTWRQFKVENMSNIRVMDDRHFNVQNDYNPNSKRYLKALAKV